ncbi:MAG: hypothetical protein Q4E57_02085 [Eubacteriales bacterium]|nr:hypothetical protein [Eubacteriales bacterium]
MNKKTIVTVTGIMLAVLFGTTGAYAYYSAQTSTAQNTFNIVAGGGASGDTVGKVAETFDPTEAKNLEPRSTFTKKAKIESGVDYSSYAYLLVTVPNINARLDGESALSYRDAVTIDFDTVNWTLVKSSTDSTSAPSVYLYRYKSILPAGNATTDLFTTVSVPDYVESEGVSGTIDLTGYMLSSVNVGVSDADADAVSHFFS